LKTRRPSSCERTRRFAQPCQRAGNTTSMATYRTECFSRNLQRRGPCCPGCASPPASISGCRKQEAVRVHGIECRGPANTDSCSTSIKSGQHPARPSSNRGRDMTSPANSMILTLVIILEDGHIPGDQRPVPTGRDSPFDLTYLILQLHWRSGRITTLTIGLTNSTTFRLRANSGDLRVIGYLATIYVIHQTFPFFPSDSAYETGDRDGEAAMVRPEEGARAPPSTPIDPTMPRNPWDVDPGDLSESKAV